MLFIIWFYLFLSLFDMFACVGCYLKYFLLRTYAGSVISLWFMCRTLIVKYLIKIELYIYMMIWLKYNLQILLSSVD
jgi:hypothetical protein